jgi:hypothetical protein
MRARPATYSAAKVRAFFDEFSFLEKHLSWKWIDFVWVKRVGNELLQTATVDNGLIRVEIWLLDRKGDLVYKVGTSRRDVYHPRKFWTREWWRRRLSGEFDRETAINALHHLGEKVKNIHYILEVKYHYTVELILYKPPKDFTLQEWLTEELKIEKSCLEQDIAEIDTLE